MPLEEYRAKRDFEATPEPSGEGAATAEGELHFVVQEHAARAHHYDFRLELDGVLLSWAVPKGPSLDPHDKRLAVHVEDHPLGYADFEGAIPAPEYGAGTVAVWDRGTWQPIGDPHAGLEKGDLKFLLFGEKLRGLWVLVRMKPRPGEKRENWLLIKERDAEVREGEEPIVTAEPRSVISNRTLDQVRDEESATRPAEQEGGLVRGAAHEAESSGSAAPADSPSSPKPQPVAAPMPRQVLPELARLVASAPTGEGWLSEVKYDGYRVLVYLEDGHARAETRSGADWSDHFTTVVQVAERLPASTAILDGEAVVFDEQGISGFELLQEALGSAPESITYACFDLLYLNGYDLRDLPLVQRKELLAELLASEPPASAIRYADHVTTDPGEFYEQACKIGLEGSMCKRADSRYLGKRDGSWLKVKCRFEQEFVVGGWTEPRRSRTGFGALLIGYYEGDKLVYAGRVGTGFNQRTLDELYKRVKRHERKTSPFVNAPDSGSVHWTRPELVVEVAFREWTNERILRQPAFLGVREDKAPREVVREVVRELPATDAQLAEDDDANEPAASVAPDSVDLVAGVHITNPAKTLLPGSSVTKLDLARYYEHVAPVMLPHVAERPLTLLRCPVGQGRGCFYQRHPDAGLPKAVRTMDVTATDGEVEKGLYIDEVAGLISLAQMGVAEIHTWMSSIDTMARPDRIVFDLDPGPDLEWSRIREAALVTRALLEELGFDVYVKTTGGKGLHVTVPIEPVYEFERIRAFTKAIVDKLVVERGDLLHGRMAKAERVGKVFVDYLRNSFAASAVAPYSTRAREGGPVSVPITWDELTDDLDPRSFTVPAVIERVSAKGDPWAELPERQASSRTLRAAFSAIS